jgi:hypothetical protein
VAFYRYWDDKTWVLVGFWVNDITAIGDKVHVLKLEEAIQNCFRILRSGEIY